MVFDLGSGPAPERARGIEPPARQRRFYKEATMAEEEGGYVLRLDGRRAMTPAKQPIAVPHRHLADAIAAEWAGQGEFLDPLAMPVTRLANSAIDGVAARMGEVREAVLAYAGTDLLCYRAGDPEGLVAEQRREWDPILAAVEARYGGRFALAEGVMHVAQPAPLLAAIARDLAAEDDAFRLAGLNIATTLTGSALIPLAMRHCGLDAEAAWRAAHVDEDWNIRLWGEDAEAMARRANRLADFRAAALAIRGS